MNRFVRVPLAVIAAIGALLSVRADAALYGNDTAATARPIIADGTAYFDQMASGSLNAFFVFRGEPNQSYSVDVWNPYGPQQVDTGSGNRCMLVEVFDAAGDIAFKSRGFDAPAPVVKYGFTQGSRWTFVLSGAARPVTLFVQENGPAPANPTICAVRLMTTTLASPRWSVNGYSDLIALSNVASTYDGLSTGSSTISGSILYFNDAGTLVGSDPFTLASNGSLQIVKPNGVAIGGATKGGIRVVHDGAPGSVIAHQTWYNPVTNAYVQYPFFPLVQSYSRGGM